MKKLLTVVPVMALLTVFTVTGVLAQSANFTGAGTEASPYIITTDSQLAFLATRVNLGDAAYNNKYYRLGNDIDLSVNYGKSFNGGKGWIPIGYPFIGHFIGHFDGNGHVIKGLFIDDTTLSYAGLFGIIGNRSTSTPTDNAVGSVQNLGLEDVYIRAGDNTGALAGFILGYGENLVGTVYQIDHPTELKNIYVDGYVSGREYVGGIVGYIAGWGYAGNSYSTAAVSASTSYVGGISGYVDGRIENCAALNPSVKAPSSAGRIVGSTTTHSSLLNNLAFTDMLNNAGTNVWGLKGPGQRDGEDITGAQIHQLATLGGRFSAAPWVTESGKLPGFRQAREIPDHIKSGSAITSVTVSPTLAFGQKGTASLSFTSTVTGVNNPPTTVNWSVSGGISGTSISATGVLTIAAGETADTLTVRATSTLDNTKSATAKVVIVPTMAGAGTSASPYIITEASQLVLLAERVNAGNVAFNSNSIHYRLGNDIDLSVYDASNTEFNRGRGWIPIGKDSEISFRANFDGNNKVISGLYINNNTIGQESDWWGAGLFGLIGSGASVKNLGLEDVNITGGNYTGALAGTIEAYPNPPAQITISNCYSTGTVRGHFYVGGIAGVLSRGNNIISNCYTTATVRGNDHVGGIVGLTGGNVRIVNSYSAGAVSVIGSGNGSNIGGLIGNVYSYETGDITTVTNSFWDMETSGRISSAGGEGKTTANMKKQATFTGWDFNTIWTIDEGSGYPQLAGFLPWTTSLANNNRVTPNPTPDSKESFDFAPVTVTAGEFTAGPNPVNKHLGAVNLFWSGKSIKSAALFVYNASGGVVKKINTNDKNSVSLNASRRAVGFWDLTDNKGRPVSAGTYLIRGTVTTADGKKEKVSTIIGVR